MEFLLDQLTKLSIEHTNIGHGPAMTADEQAKSLSGKTDAVVTKNLFLKDKKNRFYLVTALATTKVNLNTLSARLGQGKSGVRLAPDECVTSILNVPLGSVTPFCVAQPTAINVVLLLDSNLKSQSSIAVHPLINTTSTIISPASLDVFLTAVGRQALYIDLQAEPKIDRENPPDLKDIADGATPIDIGDSNEDNAAAAAVKQQSSSGGGGKKSKDSKKQTAAAASSGPGRDEAYVLTDNLLQMILGGDGVAAMDADALRKLKADVHMQVNAFRNVAYATGYKAAQKTATSLITGEYS